MHQDVRRREAFTGQAACVLDAQGRFLNVSPSLADLLQGRDPLRGQSLLEHVDGPEQVRPLLTEVLQQGPRSLQVRLRGAAGPQWVTMGLAPGGDGPGGPILVAWFTAG